jgi:hypothetical protein
MITYRVTVGEDIPAYRIAGIWFWFWPSFGMAIGQVGAASRMGAAYCGRRN